MIKLGLWMFDTWRDKTPLLPLTSFTTSALVCPSDPGAPCGHKGTVATGSCAHKATAANTPIRYLIASTVNLPTS